MLDVPLAGMRATVLGLVERCDQSAMIDRYIRLHSDIEACLDLSDFQFYQMTIERVHVVFGFGAIQWLSVDQVVFDVGLHGALAAAEANWVDCMNKGHSDSLTVFATGLLGHTGEGLIMTGIYAEGIDLSRKRNFARLEFDHMVSDSYAARKALVKLLAKAHPAV